jgi:GTPase SAR1 family protein
VGPAGLYEFHRFELLKYLGAHIVLISFAIDDPCSLDRVEEKVSLPHVLRYLLVMRSSTLTINCLLTVCWNWQWILEVAHFCPSILVILVGLKKDLRDDLLNVELSKSGLEPITKSLGDAFAHTIGAYRYLVCFSLTGEGVKDVFQTGAVASLLEPKKGEAERCCTIL